MPKRNVAQSGAQNQNLHQDEFFKQINWWHEDYEVQNDNSEISVKSELQDVSEIEL